MMTVAELKRAAAEVARDMNGGLTPQVRARFIRVRAELFRRGIFDPVLARFDSATVAQATPQEVAAELEKVAASI